MPVPRGRHGEGGRQVRELRLSLGGRHRLYADGALVAELEDRSFASGHPLLYLQNAYHTASFSDIRLYRPGRDEIPPPGPAPAKPPRALGPVKALNDLIFWVQEPGQVARFSDIRLRRG